MLQNLALQHTNLASAVPLARAHLAAPGGSPAAAGSLCARPAIVAAA